MIRWNLLFVSPPGSSLDSSSMLIFILRFYSSLRYPAISFVIIFYILGFSFVLCCIPSSCRRRVYTPCLSFELCVFVGVSRVFQFADVVANGQYSNDNKDQIVVICQRYWRVVATGWSEKRVNVVWDEGNWPIKISVKRIDMESRTQIDPGNLNI